MRKETERSIVGLENMILRINPEGIVEYINSVFLQYTETPKEKIIVKKIKEKKRRAGKTVLLTSIEEDSASDSFHKYFSKDLIEKVFQFSKQYGHLRPFFRRLANRVQVDVFISHLAYFLVCCMRRETTSSSA